MNENFITLFFMLFGLSLLWLLLVAFLHRTLKVKYTNLFSELGSPSLADSSGTTKLVFRFLLSRKPESQNSPSLSRLANLMRGLFLIILLGNVGLFIYVFTQL